MLTALLGKMKVVGLAGVAVGAMAMAPSAAKADGHFRIGINFRLPEPACDVRPVYAAPVYAAPVYAAPAYCPPPVCETPVYRPVVVPVYRPVPVYCPTPVYYRPYAYGGYYRPYCR